MNCRIAHDEAVHHEVNAQAVQQSANHCMVDQEWNNSTRKEEDGRHHQSDQEVKEETEQSSFYSTFECFLAEGAARD